MAATMNWTISTLERELSDGFVFVAHWRCTATETSGEDTFSASSYGTAGFTQDPESDSFIPYDQLTEEQVLGWVWNDGVDKDATEEALAAKIEADKHPTSAAGVPW